MIKAWLPLAGEKAIRYRPAMFSSNAPPITRCDMLTQELVNSVFEYRDGDLYYKKSVSKKARQGRKAGGIVSSGYVLVTINKKQIYAHRVIFLMHYGYLPNYIDHIDGIKLNNKIENLRAATMSQNGINRPKQANNTSGYKGVYYSIARDKWIAQIKHHQKMKNLGGFETRLDAHKRYVEEAKKIYGDYAHA